MGKRSAKSVGLAEPEPMSSPKVSKKHKHKQQFMPLSVREEQSTPKKKSKLEKRISASIIQEKTPSKKKRHSHSKFDDGVSDQTAASLQKIQKKHKKDKELKSPVRVVEKAKVSDSENEEEDEEIVADMAVAPVSEENDDAEVDIELMELPKEDLKTLILGVKSLLPENDTIAAKLRFKKLDWEKVAFGDYTSERCAKLWNAIQKRQRQYRYMSELVDDAIVWLDTPWRNAKNRAIKHHPEFPKRYMSAFLLFLQDAKADILRQNPTAKITEISRIAGQRYKKLSERDRHKYHELSAVEAKKFEAKVAQFYEKYPHLKPEVVQKYLGPKKPRAPFTIFLEEHLSREIYVADKGVYRMASREAWNNMSAKKKVAWIRKALLEYQNYLHEVEVYNIEHPNEWVKPVKSALHKDEIQLLDQAEGKPVKPPTSAYMMYTQQLMKNDEYALLAAKERVKAIAAKWNQVSKEEKQELENKLKKMHQKYDKEYTLYLEKLPEEERNRLQLEMEKTKKKKTEKVKKEKRQSVSMRDVKETVLPNHWSSMSEVDKQTYMTALNRVRTYFETKNASMREESVSEEAAESDGDDDDGGEHVEDNGKDSGESEESSDSD